MVDCTQLLLLLSVLADTESAQHVQESTCSRTVHYITLHYITLHYITLHYITLHYTTLHYITVQYMYFLRVVRRVAMRWRAESNRRRVTTVLLFSSPSYCFQLFVCLFNRCHPIYYGRQTTPFG